MYEVSEIMNIFKSIWPFLLNEITWFKLYGEPVKFSFLTLLLAISLLELMVDMVASIIGIPGEKKN